MVEERDATGMTMKVAYSTTNHLNSVNEQYGSRIWEGRLLQILLLA